MVLFVVKMLAGRDQRAFDSDCFPSVLPTQFGKFQQTLKSLEISVNISSGGEGIRCACRTVHMAQVV
jgi:hypothetical protein